MALEDPPKTEEEAILRMINRLSERLNHIADLEAQQVSVGFNGAAARGELVPEKNRIIAEIERLYDKLEALYPPRGVHADGSA